MKKVVIFCWMIVSVVSCKKELVPISDQELVAGWIDLALQITKTTPANSPTFASRCFGYFGLTMYETVVPGYEQYNSLFGKLKDLPSFGEKVPEDLDARIALNAGQAEILRLIYIQTSDANKRKIDSLEQEFLERINHQNEQITKVSSEFGYKVARKIFEWSKKDGGHRGYLYNFDKKQPIKECEGCWAPPLFAQALSHWPLHPHWGKNRVFTPSNDSLEIPYMIPYDTLKGSPYYLQMFEVYKKGNELTQSERETAIWWSDDPDSTYTPPGHSIFLMKNAFEAQKTDLITSANVYAATGMGLADAYIKCWQWKYHYFSERPNTYINKFIDQRWESFWPDPPFPAFPSGHAIQGSVASTVLSHFFGVDYPFEDKIHEGRHPDEIRKTEFVSRTFTSFGKMAEECAYSRFFGGIHTPQDNQTGLDQGKIIGENILALPWKK